MGSDWSVSPGTGTPSTTYWQTPPTADVSALDNPCHFAPANLSAAHSYVDLAGQWWWGKGGGGGRRGEGEGEEEDKRRKNNRTEEEEEEEEAEEEEKKRDRERTKQ